MNRDDEPLSEASAQELHDEREAAGENDEGTRKVVPNRAQLRAHGVRGPRRYVVRSRTKAYRAPKDGA
ncbi:MAG: hypothetical protein JOY61_24430 [Chloroflexi bacterium]|nr:hypothetical protein [Chloroflexota bacterium]